MVPTGASAVEMLALLAVTSAGDATKSGVFRAQLVVYDDCQSRAHLNCSRKLIAHTRTKAGYYTGLSGCAGRQDRAVEGCGEREGGGGEGSDDHNSRAAKHVYCVMRGDAQPPDHDQHHRAGKVENGTAVDPPQHGSQAGGEQGVVGREAVVVRDMYHGLDVLHDVRPRIDDDPREDFGGKVGGNERQTEADHAGSIGHPTDH